MQLWQTARKALGIVERAALKQLHPSGYLTQYFV